ncbi:MAG TPA: cytochrome P450, partial [Sporichthya sp.]|nr:cytochrome P450 [Sporichthya sp.]
MTMPTTRTDYDPLDVSTLAFWAQSSDDREKTFAELRRSRPVSWQAPVQSMLMPDPDDPGFWALTRHADIKRVSRDHEVFSSSAEEYGGVMLDLMPPDVLEATSSILMMDNPRHGLIRRLISSAFTPRRIGLIEDQIARQARQIVDDLVAGPADTDFVTAVAARLPMWTVSEMVGIDEDLRGEVTQAANDLVSWNDAEQIDVDGDNLMVMLNAMGTLHNAAFDLCEKRRAHPEDDLISALVAAEVEGRRLTDEDIAAFFCLICVAGNDTTRQTTSIAMKALCDFPEQREILLHDFDGNIGTAVDEFVRWASPVMTFRRTARVDVEVGGQPILAGDKLLLIYPSGNRDAAAF